MRVVAGSAGGIPLHIPKTDLRPTMDVVKGAIFSSLADIVVDCRLLDLFAGSGGLGIEALSRGAHHVVMVESQHLAVQTIKKNLEKTRLKGAVYEMDVFSYLDRLAQPGSFDIIIADPPYAKQQGDRDFTNELLASENLRAALAPGGIFVLEHRPGAKLPLKNRWTLLRQKRYGATEVAFLRIPTPEDVASDEAADLNASAPCATEPGTSESGARAARSSAAGVSKASTSDAPAPEPSAPASDAPAPEPSAPASDAPAPEPSASAACTPVPETSASAAGAPVPEGQRTIAGRRKPPEPPQQNTRPGGTADHPRQSRPVSPEPAATPQP